MDLPAGRERAKLDVALAVSYGWSLLVDGGGISEFQQKNWELHQVCRDEEVELMGDVEIVWWNLKLLQTEKQKQSIKTETTKFTMARNEFCKEIHMRIFDEQILLSDLKQNATFE